MTAITDLSLITEKSRHFCRLTLLRAVLWNSDVAHRLTIAVTCIFLFDVSIILLAVIVPCVQKKMSPINILY